MQNTIFTTDKVQNFPQSFDRKAYQEFLDEINQEFLAKELNKALDLDHIRIYTSTDEEDGFTTFTFHKIGLLYTDDDFLNKLAYQFRELPEKITDQDQETYHHIEILRKASNCSEIESISFTIILHWYC